MHVNYTPPESETRVQSYIDALLFEAPTESAAVQSFDPGHRVAVPVTGRGAADDRAAVSPFVRQIESAQKHGGTAGVVDADTRPVWGRQPFTVLTFNVSGLRLALPTEFVQSMQLLDLLAVPANDELASPLFIGSVPAVGGDDNSTLLVVDTARLVMPERYSVGMQESYRHVLTLIDTPWCLAVDSVGGELSLASQQVRWRSQHTRREWLAGTVVDKMCALLDVDALSRHLLAEQILEP